jgi:hypothetical protein
MRRPAGFALLVAALVAAAAWTVWQDAFPEWRAYQRELVEREIYRLETELVRARAELARPEARYELARIERAIREAEAAGTATARRRALAARADSLCAVADRLRHAVRAATARLERPELAERRRDLATRMDGVRRQYARETGLWPPDTVALRRLWTRRDSLSAALLALEGPSRRLADSLLAVEAEARRLRAEASRLPSPRDSLEALRARLLEPVTARESALGQLRRHVPRVREIASADGREVARCPTCHGTLDDPPGAHPALPAMETAAEIPCTVCHRGRGRALRAGEAHDGLLAAGRYSLRGRIERLLGPDPAERRRAREELRRITGADAASFGAGGGEAAPDSAAAAAWAAWWRTAEPYFEPGDAGADEEGESRLLAAGVDPWMFTARGRPLRYVGSARCLGCHETRQREHVRYWMQKKFRSIERLAGEPDRRPCLACHATGYDPATGTFAEPGVTCEACHGPGERYNEMMVTAQELIGRGETERGTALLEQASRMARGAASRRMLAGDTGPVNACVGCHHPRRHRDRGPGALERQADAAVTAAGVGR